MRVEYARIAARERDQYLFHVWVDNPIAAEHMAECLQSTLEEFAAAPVDGVEATIRGWPRPLLRHYIHPFKVYYERHPDALYVVRLHHHARRPIEHR